MRTHKPTLTVLASILALGAGLAFASTPALAVEGRAQLPFSPFGSFTEPTGIAIDQANGNVFVADSGANDVRVFGAEGGAPASGVPFELTGEHTPAGAFAFGKEGVGVAVDNACFYHKLSGGACTAFDPSNGAIYVTDVQHSVVDEFKVNGSNAYEYVRQFTGFGEGTPSAVTFGEPVGVAVDREGDLYIADYESKAIYEFNPAGEDIRKIGPLGSTVHRPDEMGFDATGDIYVHGYESEDGVVKLKRSSFVGSVESEEIMVEANTRPFVQGLAFDQAAGLLFVGRGSASFPLFSIEEYDAAGEVKSMFDRTESSVPANRVHKGIAVNESTGDVYSVDVPSTGIEVFGPLVALGSATTGGALSVGSTGVTVEGTVNPESATLPGSCEVQYGKTTVYGQSVACSPGVVGTGEAPVAVTASLVGLEPSTLYHYRVVAVNANGSNPGPGATVTTKPAFEGVLTGAASGVTAVGVTLNGAVTLGEVAGDDYFQYGESEAYGSSTPEVAVSGAAGEEVHAAAAVSGLRAGTTYYFRLVATSAIGTDYGQPVAVTTLPEVPVVLGESASLLEPREAFLSAVVDGERAATGCSFVYGLSASYGSSAPAELAAGPSGETEEAYGSLTGLEPGRIYHYAVVAHNAGGTTVGPDETFQTAAAALPVVVTGGAGEVSPASALLSGTVNPEGVPTGYEFDLGTDTSYGARVFGAAGSGSEPLAVSLDAQGLQAGTTYHYRLVASNTYGTVYGADETFTTPGVPGASIAPPLAAGLVPVPLFAPPPTTGAVSVKTASKPAKKKRKRRGKRAGKVKARAKKTTVRRAANKTGGRKAGTTRDGQGRSGR
jgi:hypothetical protein